MCAVAPSGECLRGKSPPDRMLAIHFARRLFLAAFALNLVVAVLRDSRVIGCCPACQIVVKFERSVLTTINEDVMLCQTTTYVPLFPVFFVGFGGAVGLVVTLVHVIMLSHGVSLSSMNLNRISDVPT